MPTSPRDLLRNLFAYIAEQLKDTDPRSFQLSRLAGFRREPGEIASLPGVELDLRLKGDHV